MLAFRFVVILARNLFRSRADILLELLQVRQQLACYVASGAKPTVTSADRSFWVALRRELADWARHLVIVKPATVIRWHRQGFRYYWRWKSRGRAPGRPAVDAEVIAFIETMANDNPWSAHRIAREIRALGLRVTVNTVRKYLPKRAPEPTKAQSWRTFFTNHRDVISAMDLLVVPNVTFRLLYGFFIIDHGRRVLRHFNSTFHPTAEWIVQQLREAFPGDTAPKYLICDRDGVFASAVHEAVAAMGITVTRTAPQSPWQNGVGERWIGTLRRELLDHVIVVNEKHLRRMVQEYVSYYNEDRPHMSLGEQSPAGRVDDARPGDGAKVVALPRANGLHHRYQWRRAA